MKRIKQLTAVGAASLALALGVPTAAASTPGWVGTAPVEVTEDGAVDGGWTEVPDPDEPVEAGSTTRQVGGGTWSYGSHVHNGIKVCWSDYYHPSRRHSATAKMAGVSVSEVCGRREYGQGARHHAVHPEPLLRLLERLLRWHRPQRDLRHEARHSLGPHALRAGYTATR